MTDVELLDEIEKLTPSINKLSYLFVRKMKQPSVHSQEDLFSEAVYTIIGQVKSGRPNPEKGASVSTYLITAIIGRFSHLVRKSYKLDYNPKLAHKKRTDRLHRDLSFVTQFPESLGLDILFILLDALSKREKEYLLMLISPPKDIVMKIEQDRRRARVYVREVMNMERVEEKLIRKKIKSILLEKEE